MDDTSASGQKYAGALATCTLEDFSLSGTSGDPVSVPLARDSSSLNAPKLEVYWPDGTLLCSFGVSFVASAICLLDATGTHTVLDMAQ